MSEYGGREYFASKSHHHRRHVGSPGWHFAISDFGGCLSYTFLPLSLLFVFFFFFSSPVKEPYHPSHGGMRSRRRRWSPILAPASLLVHSASSRPDSILFYLIYPSPIVHLHPATVLIPSSHHDPPAVSVPLQTTVINRYAYSV